MIALTNYGLRLALERLAEREPTSDDRDEARLLADLLTELVAPGDSPAARRLISRGMAEPVAEGVDREAVALRYRRNPLEHVGRVVFEHTSRCNFSCGHCYNARVEPVTEENPEVLARAVDLLVPMGIRRFDFIGGEVTRYGEGWLELAGHIRDRCSSAMVAIYTNGWWLGQQSFDAAGRRYPDTHAYLKELRRHGVTHVTFSLDGRGRDHDRSRSHPGLYRRILDGIGVVREHGLTPRVSLLLSSDQEMEEYVQFLAELADRIYDLPEGLTPLARAERLGNDPTNTISSVIDIGNGARRGTPRFRLDEDHARLYCKGFFRPAHALTIKASGEVALCRVSRAGEGYGNIHERDLLEILNSLQQAFVFRLHAERRLGEYRRYVDRSIFGEAFAHMCTLRAILTMIARRVEEQGLAPSDTEAVRRINLEVARYTGHSG
jgi:sulfatase maturation enzyme AslB (radical SAM superfamily)